MYKYTDKPEIVKADWDSRWLKPHQPHRFGRGTASHFRSVSSCGFSTRPPL